MNTTTKSKQGRKGSILSYSSQSIKKAKSGQELKQKPKQEPRPISKARIYWLASKLPFLNLPDHLPRSGSIHRRLGSPTSVIPQESAT